MAVGDRSGFTFLEVMISVTILGIALVSLLGSQSQSISLAGIARVETTAALLARLKMTELVTDDVTDLFSSSGDFGEAYPGFTWQAEVTDLGEDETGLEHTGDLLKRVQLVVSADEEGGVACTLERIVMAVPGNNQGP